MLGWLSGGETVGDGFVWWGGGRGVRFAGGCGRDVVLRDLRSDVDVFGGIR